MSTEGSGASRAGGDGVHNEDVFLVDEGLGLYVVCDGQSESPAGESAARAATRAIEEYVEAEEDDLGLATRQAAREVVEEAMRRALKALSDAEDSDTEFEGFGTTVTMLLVHGMLGVIGHRGDSRAYLIRRNRSHQLTLDHELTDAARDARASGFDVFAVDLAVGDTIVLCTDGAEEVVQDDTIVRAAGNLAPRVVASRIVTAAHQRSSEQDATAVVVRIGRERDSGRLELSSAPHGTKFGHTLAPRTPIEPPPLLDPRKTHPRSN